MSRIAQAFAKARSENRAALVGYLCAGDPDPVLSLAACRALISGGVDILELGVPFSDPLADGPTNQLAAQRALRSGMTPVLLWELVRRIREFSEIPIVLYTYYNLVFANGIEAWVAAARAAGVDGMLTLDLPPEESRDVAEASLAHGLATICIVAPTTPDSRIPIIAAATTGFIYYVSREGVTGVRDEVAGGVAEAVARIRRHTDLPIAVGFGIARRAHVAQVAAFADGVVVGSALVNLVYQNLETPARIAPALSALVADLAAGTRRAG
jgi:tryptophan synthase alpha chain